MGLLDENRSLDAAVAAVISAFEHGGRLYVCGNGGSSADSAHIVGELVKGFLRKRPIPASWSEAVGGAPLQCGLPAVDLTAQCAVISAISNDQGGECVYAQQVAAYGRPGDVLLGISTSGGARNVLLAAKLARALGMTVIGMTGRGGGALGAVCDILLEAPETETYLVQEAHIQLYHALCARTEAHFFPE